MSEKTTRIEDIRVWRARLEAIAERLCFRSDLKHYETIDVEALGYEALCATAPLGTVFEPITEWFNDHEMPSKNIGDLIALMGLSEEQASDLAQYQGRGRTALASVDANTIAMGVYAILSEQPAFSVAA